MRNMARKEELSKRDGGAHLWETGGTMAMAELVALALGGWNSWANVRATRAVWELRGELLSASLKSAAL